MRSWILSCELTIGIIYTRMPYQKRFRWLKCCTVELKCSIAITPTSQPASQLSSFLKLKTEALFRPNGVHASVNVIVIVIVTVECYYWWELLAISGCCFVAFPNSLHTLTHIFFTFSFAPVAFVSLLLVKTTNYSVAAVNGWLYCVWST